MDLLKGSNYLGSTIADVVPSDKGVFLTLANGDTHDIDVSTEGGAYNEFLNSLRAVDAKKRQDIIDVSKQEYAGDTDWTALNKDIKVIQSAYDNPDDAKAMLTDLGFKDIEWDDYKFKFTDNKGVSRNLNLNTSDYLKNLKKANPNKTITEDDVYKYMYEDVKKLLTETSRDKYIKEEKSKGNKTKTVSKVPAVGEVKNGYKFKGGDPNDKNSWEKV